MKDNIESKNIGNRKFVLELRFDAKVILLDKKGEIVEKIQDAKVISSNEWEIGQSEIVIRDNRKKEEAQNIITINLQRLSFISYNIGTVAAFYAKFEKIRDAVISVIGEINITRIGCRIIGTYFCQSTNFSSLLSNFKSSFPSQFLLDNYPAKDFIFHLVYENGMYQIGPVSEDDGFYSREFPVSTCKKHVGIAIDTDNYLTNDVKPINEKSLIKDVYTLSLSVEKDLLGHLSNM